MRFHHPGWFLLIISLFTFALTLYLPFVTVLNREVMLAVFIPLSILHAALLLGLRWSAWALMVVYGLGVCFALFQFALFLFGQPFSWRSLARAAFHLFIVFDLKRWLDDN